MPAPRKCFATTMRPLVGLAGKHREGVSLRSETGALSHGEGLTWARSPLLPPLPRQVADLRLSGRPSDFGPGLCSSLTTLQPVTLKLTGLGHTRPHRCGRGRTISEPLNRSLDAFSKDERHPGEAKGLTAPEDGQTGPRLPLAWFRLRRPPRFIWPCHMHTPLQVGTWRPL